MRTKNQKGFPMGGYSPFTTDSMREDVLKRIEARAIWLGAVITVVTYLILVVTVIILAQANVILEDTAFGWGYGGLLLCPFTGVAGGMTYYVIVAWRDL